MPVEGDRSMVGFRVNVFVEARNMPAAKAEAISQIGEEWATGRYARGNHGDRPKLRAEEIRRAKPSEKAGRQGYLFFPGGENE